jgi:peroxiredoxin
MTIQIGDQVPEVILKRIREGVETVDTRALFDGRKAVLFAVPGAFTPTCSECCWATRRAFANSICRVWSGGPQG